MDDLVTFSSQELWLLFSQVGPSVIVGLSDPTVGLLAYEIESMQIDAQNSLLEKKIIKLESENQWLVREPLNDWIKTIADPVHTLVMVHSDSSTTEIVNSYHYSKDKIIELAEQESGKYSIKSLEPRGDLGEFLLAPLNSVIYLQRDELPIILSEKALTKANEQITKRRPEQAKKYLENSFSSPDQLNRFVHALTTPISRFSLISFIHRNQVAKSKTSGFSVIASDQDIWLLMPENEFLDFVRVKSIIKLELEDTIHSFIPTQELAQ